MRFAIAAAAAGFASIAAADMVNGTSPVYVTEVVTAFTTYCPEATMLTHGGSTYTVSSATTLTISNCPCTVTRPATSSVVTSCAKCSSTPVAPVSESSASVYSSPVAPVSYSSAPAPAPTSSSVPVAPVPYTTSSAPVAPVTATFVPSATPYQSANGTTAVYSSGYPVGPVGTSSATSSLTATGSPIATYTGAASSFNAAGAGIMALFGLAMAL